MIEYRNVKKYFGDRQIIKGINMKIQKGEFVVVIGPSGCGKTTTVKMINRLIDASEGEIFINGVNNKDMDLIQLRTSIGYVIQQIGLFPNMTVEENISVVPKIMKWEKKKTKDRVKELMEMVNMPYEEYRNKYPSQLSGGQQQRIGVLRALAVNPPIIIMDEPFGALDPITREILQSEVKKIQKELNITAIFITHDMHEAVKMADRIVFMDQGRILQVATPRELVLHPANETVARFISFQEVEITEQQLTAGDFMEKKEILSVEDDALIVGEDEPMNMIGKNYDFTGNKNIYVKDQEGILVGELTVAGMLRHFIRKV